MQPKAVVHDPQPIKIMQKCSAAAPVSASLPPNGAGTATVPLAMKSAKGALHSLLFSYTPGLWKYPLWTPVPQFQ